MPPAQTRKAEAGVWKLVFLVAGLSVPSVVMPGTTGREQSSEAWGVDPVDGLEVTLGQVKGAGGQWGKCSLCRGQGQRGWAKEARVSLAAGVRLERWLNWVRPSAQPGLGPDLLALGPAELSPLGLCLPSILRSKPSQRVGRCEAWRAARTLTLHRPGCVTSASSLLLPGFSGL